MVSLKFNFFNLGFGSVKFSQPFSTLSLIASKNGLTDGTDDTFIFYWRLKSFYDNPLMVDNFSLNTSSYYELSELLSYYNALERYCKPLSYFTDWSRLPKLSLVTMLSFKHVKLFVNLSLTVFFYFILSKSPFTISFLMSTIPFV